MKDLTTVLPFEHKERAQFNPAGYWELPKNVYVTGIDSIMIAIIDSAIEETLVAFWDEDEQMWFHYTNCFALDGGDDDSTKLAICKWIEKRNK